MNAMSFLEAQLLNALNRPCGMALKFAVNKAIDNGHWVDGFEIAIKSGELDSNEIRELLGIVSNIFPETSISPTKFLAVINDALPQSALAPITWLIADDMTIIASDGLRVARLTLSNCIWSTPRLSFDGIKLIDVDEKRITGLAWLLRPNDEMDSFTLALNDGSILTGTIVGP
jgi:hypothetical protein